MSSSEPAAALTRPSTPHPGRRQVFLGGRNQAALAELIPAMEDRYFPKSVRVMLDPRGAKSDIVSSVRKAAELLLYEWPEGGGPKLSAAKRACLAALEGTGTTAAAQRAFIAAAKEVDVLFEAPKR